MIAYVATRGAGDTPDGSSGLGTSATTGLAPGTSLTGVTTPDPGGSSVVTAVAQEARAKRTVLKGNGNDVVTIMVYLCATDLESQSGMATADLNEILYAEDSDKVNVIIETGGASRWRNTIKGRAPALLNDQLVDISTRRPANGRSRTCRWETAAT